MSDVKAIETRYAGCRFRSRLEARWAVFFDALGLKWEYEPEGYMVGPDGDQRPYLPDFWLPQIEQWVEVKGPIPTHHERCLIAHACVTHEGWGLPNNHNGVLYLGGLPHLKEGTAAAHRKFFFYKGDLVQSFHAWHRPWQYNSPGSFSWFGPEWYLVNGIDGCPFEMDEGLINSTSAWGTSPCLAEDYGREDETPHKRYVAEAYTAARSARFEHGESG